MKRNSTAMGALHPILFFLAIYGISLFLAFFVCRTVYYTFNGAETVMEPAKDVRQVKLSTSAIAATAYK